MVTLKVKKLVPEAKLPTYAYDPNEECLDFYAAEDVTLYGDKPIRVSTGLAIELEPGYRLVFKEKSGLALKNLDVKAGVIDSNYRSSVDVIVRMAFKTQFHIAAGDKIAQAKIEKVIPAEIIEVDELSDTSRGQKGFGSSGA